MIREAKYDALKHIELDKNGLWKISASASPLLKHLLKILYHQHCTASDEELQTLIWDKSKTSLCSKE